MVLKGITARLKGYLQNAINNHNAINKRFVDSYGMIIEYSITHAIA
jgi:hypothetical protein